MDEARTAERELKAGHDRGPLHGIPYGAKDLLATAGGIPTTWGATPFKDQQFDRGRDGVERLRAAGAVLVAKLSMVELAGGMGYDQPNASLTGPGLNPWNAAGVERRLVQRLRLGGRGGRRALRHRLRDVGLDHDARLVLRHLRPAAHLRAREQAGRDGALLDARQARPDVPHGGRLRPRLAGDRRATTRRTTRASRSPIATHPSGRARAASGSACCTSRRRRRSRRSGANYHAALDVLRGIATIEEVTLPDLPYGPVTETILRAEAASAFDDFMASGKSPN